MDNQNGTATLENSLVISYKTKLALSMWSINCAPWYLPKGVHTKNCIYIVIAALFIIAKIWNKPKCLSVGEWINKLWHSQKMEYYSARRIRNLPTLKQLTLRWLSREEDNWVGNNT